MEANAIGAARAMMRPEMALVDPSRLSARLRTLHGAEPLLRAIEEGGEEVYLVGGAVRDLCLGGVPVDFDLAVAGEIGPLAARLGSRVRPHERFQTATVVGPDHTRYDLAATRREAYATPGALPEVAPAGIEADLRRRDFTVNALALGLGGPRRGELVSVADGLADVDAGRLRVLHDASFADDPTRLLRLARYAGRLSFMIDPGTERLARAAVAGSALDTVSGPRIGAELELLADDPGALDGFGVLRALGIDAAIAPGFGLGPADAQLARRALALLPPSADPAALMLGLAADGVGDDQVMYGLFSHLGLAAPRRNAALAVASAAVLQTRLAAAGRPSEIDALIGRTSVEAVAAAAARGDPASLIREWLRAGRRTAIVITGDDLLAAGIAAGPQIARGLRAARAARLDGFAPDREAQLAAALRAVGNAGSPGAGV
jgi:tRNA nucleotidyltransferase (CCA-adding enzyme)